MENKEQINAQYVKMTQTPVSKLILTLGLPTVISMLVTNIYNMADTYFVGTIGTSASGATGIVFGLMSILQAFGFMFGHGAGANIARKLGNHDVKAAKIYAATSFWCSIFVGTFIMLAGFLFMDPLMRLLGSTDTILPYARTYAFFILIAGPAMTSSCVMNNILRYEGKAFFAMIGLTLGGVLNIFGDYFFVDICNMGIAGAGLSTAISQYISMAVLMIPYLQGKTQSTFNPKDFGREFIVYKDIIKGCNLYELAGLIKNIHVRRVKRLNEGKKPTATDEKYYKVMEDNFISEIAFVLGKSKPEIKDWLADELANA